MGNAANKPSTLWGIVLAGGDYTPLAPFVRKLRGDDLPKPFVNFLGKRSALEHAFARAEKLIAPERLLAVVNRDHLKHPEAQRQIGARMKGTVIVQPRNRGSLAETLLALLHVYHRDPLATVALFAADHFILDEDRFLSYLYLACRAVERAPSTLVALGTPATTSHSGRGYIVTQEEPERLRGFGIRRVSSYIESPSVAELPQLLERRPLWNTKAVVFKAFTLLDLTARIAPSLHASMERIGAVVGARKEPSIVLDAFRDLEPCDFSSGLLAHLPQARPDSFMALPVEGVLWSDWSTPLEIVTVLNQAGYLGRANGLTERHLFALWANHRGRRERSQKKNESVLRM
jgi:mannose-1-phosphate guanylyltransferase